MDLDVSGPDDRVALGLAAVFTPVVEIQVLQVQQRQSILMRGPLEDSLGQVSPPPGEGGSVETARRPAGQTQS